MSVKNEHEDYVEYKVSWEEIRDCVKGNSAIKKKGEKYLPKLSGHTAEDYQRYQKRVKFFGATGRALDGLHGNVFRKAAEQSAEVSDNFAKSLKDVDLMGTSIEQFVSDLTYDCLQTNWGGILVDYARGEEVRSLAEAEQQGLRAYLKYYKAENVINWEYKTVNGKTQLTMVVLAEPYSEPDPKDRFTTKKWMKYRVLKLDPATKIYTQDAYDEKVSLDNPSEQDISIKMNGKPLNEIPFYPCPGFIPEKSMLYDLAQLNIQHYQDTADYNNGKHFTSIPTALFIGVRPKINETTNQEEPFYLGGSKAICLSNDTGAPIDAKYLEFTGAGMKTLAEGITHLEGQMAILGAHIIAAEKKGVESPEALRIHRIGENGVLAAFVRNISDQVTKACRMKGKWDGENPVILEDWAINFNTDYDFSDESVQTLSILLTGRASGELPRYSVYMGAKMLNLIPEQWDFDTFCAELEKDKNIIEPIDPPDLPKEKDGEEE